MGDLCVLNTRLYFLVFSLLNEAATSVSIMMPTCVTSAPSQLCAAPPPPPPPLLLPLLESRLCSPGSSVRTNMETWPTTLDEFIREQGPPAGWNSSLTFSRHHPLLTPQLTSTSAPLLQEQRGRDPPFHSIFISFYHFLPGYTLAPGNYHLISLMRWGKISLSRKSVITQELYFFFIFLSLSWRRRVGKY